MACRDDAVAIPSWKPSRSGPHPLPYSHTDTRRPPIGAGDSWRSTAWPPAAAALPTTSERRPGSSSTAVAEVLDGPTGVAAPFGHQAQHEVGARVAGIALQRLAQVPLGLVGLAVIAEQAAQVEPGRRMGRDGHRPPRVFDRLR